MANMLRLDVEPPLVGRDAALQILSDQLRARPGAIIVWGAPDVGATRLIHEALRALPDGVTRVDVTSGHDSPAGRLATALEVTGWSPDIVRAARSQHFVADLGAIGSDEIDEFEEIGRLLAGSGGTVIARAPAPGRRAPSLHLPALSDEQAAELALAAAPGLDPARARMIADLGDGRPGVLVALARQIVTDDPGAPVRIPQTLLASALEDVSALGPTVLEVARSAAILGDAAATDWLMRVCDAPPDAVERSIDQLVQAGVAREEPGRDELVFSRRVVRAAVLAGLGPRDRRARHAAALAAGRDLGKPPAALVHHAEGCGDRIAVIETATQAVEQGLVSGEIDDITRLCDMALAAWRLEDGEATRGTILLRRGIVAMNRSAWADAADDLDEAALALRFADQDSALRAITSAALAAWSRGERRRAQDLLLGFLGRTPGPPTLARVEALDSAVVIAVSIARNRETHRLAVQARRAAIACGSPHAGTRVLALMGWARTALSGCDTGLRHMRRARAEALRSGEFRWASLTAVLGTHCLLSLGRAAEAEEDSRTGAAFAAEHGLADHHALLIGNVGESLAAQGRLADARRHLEDGTRMWLDLGAETPLTTDPAMGWLLTQEGRFCDAVTHFRRLLAAEDESAMTFHDMVAVVAGLATAEWELGHAEEARDAVRRALGLWHETDDRLFAIPLLAIAVQVGEAAEAEDWLGELAEVGAAGSSIAPPFLALARGHALRATDHATARDSYLAAAADFEERGLNWWAARAVLFAGCCACEQAGDDLTDAHRRFGRMGAPEWQTIVEGRLRAVGRKPPSRIAATDGFGNLSQRETEVLRWLMLGLSNRDIGTRLFISEHTVARHLARMFAKLEVTNRAAAIALAHEEGLTPASASVDDLEGRA